MIGILKSATTISKKRRRYLKSNLYLDLGKSPRKNKSVRLRYWKSHTTIKKWPSEIVKVALDILMNAIHILKIYTDQDHHKVRRDLKKHDLYIKKYYDL